MLVRRSWSVMNGSEMDSSDENSSSNLSNNNTQTYNSNNLTEKWVYGSKQENPTSYSAYSSDEDEYDRAHVHKKTEPVPVHKRRYLKPYLNPFELERRLERQYRQIVPKIRYRFLIQTGSERNGGTESPVFFKLFGTAGVWEATQLRSGPPSRSEPTSIRFAPGSQVELMLDGPVIGELRKIKLWHNGKSLKDDWYLDFIEITCYKLNQTWRFICDQWIAKKSNSNPIMLTLGSNVLDSDKAKNLTEYAIMIKTSSKPLVTGRDVNVQFQFVCGKGQTPVFNMLSQHVDLFQPLQLDCFLVRSSLDLGKPEKLRMAHNGKRTHEWSVESIRVYYSKDPGHFYVFKVEKWLEKNEKMNAIIGMQALVPVAPGEKHAESGKMMYHISVMTGNVRFGGTDAKVYIQFKGSTGLSEVHRLHNPRTKQEFERGQIDHFHILDKNVGDLKLIKIWHDNSGTAPGWFLQAVLIKAIPTTLSGQQDKHDSELRDQVDRLIKKYRIKELNLQDSLRGRGSSRRPVSSSKNRSKSADAVSASASSSQPSQSNPSSPTPPSKRSPSAESSKSDQVVVDGRKSPSSSSVRSGHVSLKNVLRKNHAKAQLSRSSPALSILKKSASPRTTRKSVKFDAVTTTSTSADTAAKTKSSSGKETSSSKSESKTAPRLEMNMEWLMTIVYAENGPVRGMRTVENFDPNIKSIDNSLVDAYNNKMKKLDKVKGQQTTSGAEPSTKSPDLSKVKPENIVYVFECNKWLSKDADDRKIERIIKLSNVLTSK